MFDFMLNQYLIGLGEFTGQESYQDHPQSIFCWLLFFGATFMTQVTMLNLLIAIMGNSFNKVIEGKDLYAMQTKLAFLSEYNDIINRVQAKQKFDNFIFVVYPIVDDDQREE